MAENGAIQGTGNKEEEYLVMRFDPSTIKHLGVQMYYTLPPVIAELVANCYDADAEHVKIYLQDAGEKSIKVVDDGEGMEFADLNPKFLLIGANRRERDSKQLTSEKNRPVIGKKGLGKLSFFGISDYITVETIKSGKYNKFCLALNAIKTAKGEYRPEVLIKNEPTEKQSGTTVILTTLKRKSAFQPGDIARSLARTFLIFEKDFSVEIYHNGRKVSDITNSLRFEDTAAQFQWDFPLSDDIYNTIGVIGYAYRKNVTGVIISSSKTIPTNMRGVALFSRGKLVNDHSFFDIKATSHGYSYITGWLDVSFIDDWATDVIATNRRSLNWEEEDTAGLRDYLNKTITYIFNQQTKLRAEKKKGEIKKLTGVDIDEWVNSLPKHDGTLARKIVDTIVKSEELDENKSADLVGYVRDSFQFESFKEFALDIDNLAGADEVALIKLLQDWKLIESREFYKLSLVRVETIGRFEEYIRVNAKEVPTVHEFLKEFPWLLDPRIMEFKHEVYYSNLLKEKYTESEDPEDNRRIDFLCTSIADSLFIIELKRPKHKLSQKDLLQANDYRTFVVSLQGNEPETSKRVVAYVICGQQSDDRKVAALARNFRGGGEIYVRTYHELLTAAQAYHREFIEKYEQLESGREKEQGS